MSVSCPDGDLRPGGTAQKCGEDSKYGIPILSCYRGPIQRGQVKHREILRQIICCPNFCADLATESLATYRQVQHGVEGGR